MINKETYKNELVRMWDENRSAKYKGYDGCLGVDCTKCPIRKFCCSYGDSIVKACNAFEIIETVERWGKEHHQKKYIVSQYEYDILKAYTDSLGIANGMPMLSFPVFGILHYYQGYFRGADDGISIRDYFDNCEVEK